MSPGTGGDPDMTRDDTRLTADIWVFGSLPLEGGNNTTIRYNIFALNVGSILDAVFCALLKHVTITGRQPAFKLT